MKKLLREKGQVARPRITRDNLQYWNINDVIIKLPKVGRIDYEHFEAIAIEQLDMSWWDLDYWMGQNGIS